jgi:predicted transcriptional regulator
MPNKNLPAGLELPSGQDVYDALMSEIEPELTSSQIPLLAKKYAKESASDKAARLKRYNAAYVSYGEAFKKWSDELNQLVIRMKHDAMASAESDDRTLEAADLSRLETSFAS